MTPWSYTRPFPTIHVPSGTLTLAPAASIQFLGTSARRTRSHMHITNLDSANSLKWQSLNGTNGGTIFPQVIVTLHTPDAIQITNQSAGTVSFEVSEFYFDEGRSAIQPPTAGGGGGGGGGGATGGSQGGYGGQSQIR